LNEKLLFLLTNYCWSQGNAAFENETRFGQSKPANKAES